MGNTIEFETVLDGTPIYVRSVNDDVIEQRYNQETAKSIQHTDRMLTEGTLYPISEDINSYWEKLMEEIRNDNLV
ncbi:hypothetical protein HMPREF9318_01687 [Streptococcus urinalis FB127-CNA-2]|uniref:Uncharacterized protein n=1 Tax=Streptococcus urinalis 2285-97 TaxID=764291 RepID=G5KET6_9STRE|nr:hypothetical protein [Streptococcus urinalis]EHJ57075.1 hypothetical protein STRUR_2145 [Streptococcus urinalis 2285-97]EKS18188.1 hypothetical protein HMPREF9318_01687 [Streptococcus urinalis FB127-CNA-2]VEF32987.1 Uncharacterised protein [Streptococcus urinalis]